VVSRPLPHRCRTRRTQRFLPSQAARDLLARQRKHGDRTVWLHGAASAAAAPNAWALSVGSRRLIHPDLVHKSDAGGVRSGGWGPVRRWPGRGPGACFRTGGWGIGVCSVKHGGSEVVVAGLEGPGFGARWWPGWVACWSRATGCAAGRGHGDTDQARAMLSSLRGAAILAGCWAGPPRYTWVSLRKNYRGSRRPDGCAQRSTSWTLNPVLGGTAGCVAVDWGSAPDNRPVMTSRRITGRREGNRIASVAMNDTAPPAGDL